MPYVRKNKVVEASVDEGKTYEDMTQESTVMEQDTAPVQKKKMTPEELRAFRIANLKKATENARGVYDKRREEKELKKAEEKRLKEEVARLEKEALEKKKVVLEKRVSVLDKETAIVDKKATKLVENVPVVRKTKPKAKKVVYVEETESESEEEEEVIIKRKPKANKVAPVPQPTVMNPIEELSNRQIREEMKKLQMEMLAKSLWGN